ncbi:uncharacterized protein A4U43_C04F31950 [Asparagus officinalis]|uniref:Uncharacterized protein n=1 Tax=Asparagus officinalis TaxID=4686 RepID=A0A5P1F521_ASPOF|nr:uncharacterized protein A4U43_C04F31950 [Asparagus officinalis]
MSKSRGSSIEQLEMACAEDSISLMGMGVIGAPQDILALVVLFEVIKVILWGHFLFRKRGSRVRAGFLHSYLASSGLHSDKDSIKALTEDTFVAGSIATVLALEWAMAELVTKSEVVKKMQNELGGKVGLKNIVTKEDLIKMNLEVGDGDLGIAPDQSIASLVLRQVTEDTHAQGYEIRSRRACAVNQQLSIVEDSGATLANLRVSF